jgi:tetratricopeptide (TPR) repeat protein
MNKNWLIAVVLVIALYTPVVAQEEGSNTDYQYVLIEAVKQKNLGNLPEAVKLYNLVIKDKPDCAVAYYESGTIYLITKQLDMAKRNLEKAYSLSTANYWYTLAYLNALAALKEYDEAVDILKDKIRTEAEKTEWEYKLAVTYFTMDKPGKARKALEKIEKEKGFSEKITLLKASIYESEQKYGLARDEIEKVMLIFPEAIQFRIVAAELCLKSGEEEEAAGYYLDILAVDSMNIFALTNLTDHYRKKEEFGKSYKYLARSFESDQIEVDRKLAILSYYLSDEDHFRKYYKELDRVIEAFARSNPEESDLNLLAADFYIQNQVYFKAYEHLKHYLELEKGSYNIYMQTILLANAAALDQELIYMSDKALELFPDSADIRFFKGIALYQKQDYEGVILNFKELSYENFSSGEYASQAKMLVAEAYYGLEDYAKSDSLFEELIQEEPDNYTIKNNFSYYLAERGERLEQAKLWSAEVIKNNPDNATFLDTYAWILYKMKLYSEAEKHVLLALEKGGENDPDVNEHAGDIQKALDSFQIAESYYIKAILLGGERKRLEDKIEELK